jgi:hypothetical protein
MTARLKDTQKTVPTYLVKEPGESRVLISRQLFHYEEARLLAIKWHGIVTNESWARRNCQ